MDPTADYSMAIEYRGPPVLYEIPRAVPIEIDRIPLASVAADDSSTPLRRRLVPVVQPLPSPPPLNKSSGELLAASPTSVIPLDAEISGEVGSSSELKPRASTESVLTSEFDLTSSVSNSDEDEPPEHHAKLVTFRDSPGSASPAIETSGEHRDEEFEAKTKKGSCYKCSRGNRFTEKEACLACDAKYCSRCLLRAMGSMPEGRKCVSCIGFPIEEPKRARLGKSSRLLKRLLSSSEVQLVMQAERECEVNQLRPEYVCVNGKNLSQEEMVLLQSSACPPAKLNPGYYWYDKVAGFWGKEGHKPHQIISPHLNIGGSLVRNASNGNTGILINEREITKVEMRMLQWAGVECAGNPHYWVNADGTYQEEGHKNIKGQIWGKPTMKLFCSILSLPIPPCKAANTSSEELNDIANRHLPGYLEHKTLQKLLLVGYHGSGTSTIFKQAKFLYKNVPFSDDERQSIKVIIQSNIYTYLGILLEGREIFEEELLLERKRNCSLHSSVTGNGESDECGDATEYSISPRLKSFSDWFLKVMASGDLEAIFPAATREYAPRVEELWNDAAIQSTYRRQSELRLLPSVASYFLERVVDISRVDYVPSDKDILYAEGITSSYGLTCTDLFPNQLAFDGNGNDAADQQDTLIRYQLIKLHSKGLGENCKWLDMFEDVRMVIFCVSASDYDEYDDSNGSPQNKMMESKRLFESIVAHPTFFQTDFLLVLNKLDLLEHKIEQSPLTSCHWFDDFAPVVSRHRPHRGNIGTTMAHHAFHYIAVKFKRLFASLTGRKLYVTSTNELDADSVDFGLRYAREIVKWEEERSTYGSDEYSAYSTEPSSYSH